VKGDIKKRTGRPVTVRLDDDVPVDRYVLEYCLKEFEAGKARFRILDEYFHGENSIKNRVVQDTLKPNNKLAHNFSKYISRIATAYFMGDGIRYAVDDAAYKAELDVILDGNLTPVKHFEEAIYMSRMGRSFELLYINEEGKLKTQAFDGDEICPVFGGGIGRYLAMALRPYEIKDIRSRRATKYCDVYTKNEVIVFEKRPGGAWKEIRRITHNFSDVPVIVRQNNISATGDYEDVIPQIDGYDRAQSDTANDLDYFTNAYLALEGISDLTATDDDGNELSASEAAKVMKEERVLYFPAGSKGYYITKPAGDDTAESHKSRLYKDIFFISQVPNLTDENFSGNITGVAQKFKLFGLDELTKEKQQYFTSAEKKKIRLITEYINALKSTKYDWRTVEITYDRTAITNLLETAEIMNYLRDILSDETLLGLFPGVDTAEELKRKLKERQDRENLTPPPGDDGVF
jgi:SPP1 family phage portal protein